MAHKAALGHSALIFMFYNLKIMSRCGKDTSTSVFLCGVPSAGNKGELPIVKTKLKQPFLGNGMLTNHWHCDYRSLSAELQKESRKNFKYFAAIKSL